MTRSKASKVEPGLSLLRAAQGGKRRRAESDLDRIQRDISGAVDFAAAEFMQALHSLLSRAFWARKDVSQQALAELLGVSAGRVSQVLNGEENLRASTFARYARALGYEIAVRFISVDPLARELGSESRSGTLMNDVFIQLVSDGARTVPQITFRPSGFGPDTRAVSHVAFVGRTDISQSQRNFELTPAIPGGQLDV